MSFTPGLKRVVFLSYLRMGRIFEVDLRLLRRISLGPGVFLDVGANVGQSALSFAVIRPEREIMSFEPNPELTKDLLWVKKLLGPRFTFHSVALGGEEGKGVLSVPQLNGRRISTRGRLAKKPQKPSEDEETLQSPRVEGSASVPIRTLDSFRLKPAVIKIDVEGYEIDVLQGGENTVLTSRPIVIFEAGKGVDRVQALLESWDFSIYEPRGGGKCCPYTEGANGSNLYAFPNENLPDKRALLLTRS